MREVYTQQRDVERLERAPAWVQWLYGLAVFGSMAAVAVYALSAHEPEAWERNTALEVALITGTPSPLEMLMEDYGKPSADGVLAGLRAPSKPYDFDEDCRIERAEYEPRRKPSLATAAKTVRGELGCAFSTPRVRGKWRCPSAGAGSSAARA